MGTKKRSTIRYAHANQHGQSNGNPIVTLEAVLDRAMEKYRVGAESEIPAILEAIAGRIAELNPRQRAGYLSLWSIGCAHSNKLIDAESAVLELSKLVPESPDPWFVLTFVHLSMREYAKAIDAGNSFCNLLGRVSPTVFPAFCSSNQHHSQVCNMMAVAEKESGKIDDAIAHYRQSIAADRGNHLPYLNLAALFRSTGRPDEAKAVVAAGVKNARQVHELRMLEQSGAGAALVSACMIVKNEEELLPDCLASIRDWVDEIVIVDTGSTDRTAEIAQSFGARVYHHPWEGNFSKARNQSLSYATGDWIFIIDADERIYSEDVPHLQKLLRDERAQVISINVYNVYGDDEESVTFLPSTRFFRRSLGLRYEGIVHNVLAYPESQPILRTNIRLKHLGYGLDPEKMRRKLARSRELLEKQLAQTPDSAFALFNYAQLLRGEKVENPNQNADVIIESAQKAIALTDPDRATERHIHLMCLDQIAWTKFRLGEFEVAEEYAKRALTFKPNYLDPLLLLAHCAARREKYSLAKTRYHEYLKAQAEYDPARETDNIIMLHVDGRVSAWYSLGMIAELENDPVQAQQWYEKIAAGGRAYLDTAAHLARLALKRNDLVSAERWFRVHFESHEGTVETLCAFGNVLLALGRPKVAAQAFSSGLQILSTDENCLIGLAKAEAETGNTSRAISLAKSAVGTGEPKHQILSDYADILFSVGEYEAAAETYRNMLSRRPNDVETTYNLANCCFKMKRYGEAEPLYQSCLTDDELGMRAQLQLGLCHAQLGNLGSAHESLCGYVRQNPDSANVVNVLADISFRLGKYRESLAYVERYLQSHADDIPALLLLSDCYLQLGHSESALIGYRRILTLHPGYRPAEERIAQLAGSVPVR
jgi:tetratricopeptide (TPR) repeat protein